MEKALYAVDELSGFILAVAYVRPEGLTGMTPKSVKKKLKDRSFAAAVGREELRAGAEALGVDFDAHLETVIGALAGAQAGTAGPMTRGSSWRTETSPCRCWAVALRSSGSGATSCNESCAISSHSVRPPTYSHEHMFQSMKQRFETLLSRVDDILADHPDEWRDDAGEPPVLPAGDHRAHPHRRPLRAQPRRRHGSVPTPAAQCLSPVRPGRSAERSGQRQNA